MNFLAELRGRFEAALQPFTDDPAPYLAMVRPAQDPKFGDFQANFAMPLAKQRQTNPRELAGEIVANLQVDDLCDPPEVAGPGFINLRLRDDRLQAETNRLVGDENLGIVPVARPRNYVVDFSSPNVAKPMHVGHLRSTVIGDALQRILERLGHKVTSDNHIGDWGTQFGMIIYGYKHFLDEEAYRRNPVDELARLYRLVNDICEYYASWPAIDGLTKWRAEAETELRQAQEEQQDKKRIRKLRAKVEEYDAKLAEYQSKREKVENNPQLKQLADQHPDIAVKSREETAKLHANDTDNLALWKEFLPPCLQALQRIYDRLEIDFDETLGESFYQPMLGDVVEDLQQRGLARESEGALCVFVEENEAPFIVRKRDGAYTYATTDLATIRHRVEQWNADALLYVVDARQSEHFRLLFETARLWGYDETEYRHVSFGTILGDDGRPFKTRSGDTVGLESLLDESVRRARRIVDENDDAKEQPELDGEARARVAEIVGIGAIKYADLKHNRESDYVFNWEKMLATNGDTATYMQYACARIRGIFRKGGVDRARLVEEGSEIRLQQPQERTLGLQLNRFPEALADVIADYRPNVLTAYLFATAECFSDFYNHCPVLQAEDEAVRTSRLLLCDLTARIIEEGLRLLGIHTAERM